MSHRFSSDRNYNNEQIDLDFIAGDGDNSDEEISSIGKRRRNRVQVHSQSIELANHRIINLRNKLRDLQDDITELNHQIGEAKAEKETLISEHMHVMNELDNIKDLKTTCVDQINTLMAEVNQGMRNITDPLENQVKSVLNLCQNAINAKLIPELQKIEKMGVDKCKICLTDDINICFISCGHTSCASCAIRMDNCHICRAFIIETQNIYL